MLGNFVSLISNKDSLVGLLGLQSTEVAILASHPAAPGSILSVTKNFSLDVAAIY